jgi:hypothetical protein
MNDANPKAQDVLELLTGLSNLKRLDLPPSSDLSLGFDGGHWCGNAYFGEEGRMYLRQVIREGAEATTKGGEIVVATLPSLAEFSIGEETPTIRRRGDGKVKVIWPWSERMNQWLNDQLPDTATGLTVREDKIPLKDDKASTN